MTRIGLGVVSLVRPAAKKESMCLLRFSVLGCVAEAGSYSVTRSSDPRCGPRQQRSWNHMKAEEVPAIEQFLFIGPDAGTALGQG